jgi:hypothetical protein
MEDTSTSMRWPFLTKAEMSAVTMTAATFLDWSVPAGRVMPKRWSMFATACTV